MDITELKEAAKEFIANPMNKEELPEKKLTNIPELGQVMVSKQVISLQNDNGTSYELYIAVQNELARAYNELHNEMAMSEFGESFDALMEKGDKDKTKAIKTVYPQRISEAEPKNVGGN